MRDTTELPDVLTADEVATYLRLSRTTVFRHCKRGDLPAFRIGRSWRVQRSDLEQYIERNRAKQRAWPGSAALDESRDQSP
jgi:putative molybdopterin biosynthesis protein